MLSTHQKKSQVKRPNLREMVKAERKVIRSRLIKVAHPRTS
jgi:hypothetical protein